MKSIAIQRVADVRELRIDAHFHTLRTPVEFLLDGQVRGMPISEPEFRRVRNGVNLKEAAYEVDQDLAAYLYVSVGGFSRGVLREDRCTSLKDKRRYSYKDDPEDLKAESDEVLVTRSGTPGIAWSPCLQTDIRFPLVPSGFVIRVSCSGTQIAPAFLCAILNHPMWRVWTSAAAAGKRQRNLSQEHLAQTIIPRVPGAAQESIGASYGDAMNELVQELDTRPSPMDIADETIESVLGEGIPRLRPGRRAKDTVSLLDVAASPTLRIDGRYHRSDVRAVVNKLADWPSVALGAFLENGILKNSQPTILTDAPDDFGPRVVCTAALQHGTVVRDATKATTDAQLASAGTRALRVSDLLVAMDGEGSIGKAAVFDGDYEAVTDSHVAVLRLREPAHAHALAAFINSSLGQAQVSIATSGSTGQTQISVDDLIGLRLPGWLTAGASAIAGVYQEVLVSYESEKSLANRLMVGAAGKTSEVLLRSDVFSTSAARSFEVLSEGTRLASLLATLEPWMF